VMVNGTPEEFRKHIAAETDRWRALKAAGIELE
jgi:hypothetical protein